MLHLPRLCFLLYLWIIESLLLQESHVAPLHPAPPPRHGHVLVVGRVVGICHVDVDQIVVVIVVVIIVVVVIVIDVVGGVDDGVDHCQDEAEEAKGGHSPSTGVNTLQKCKI